MSAGLAGTAPPGGIIGDIEILRGIAISMVLIEHLPLNLLTDNRWFFRFATVWWRGAMGVDLFFAISGFVIARTLLPQLEAGRRAHNLLAVMRRFWLRRAFRLLPAAWLWLAVPLALSAWLGSASVFGDIHDNLAVAAAAILNVANLYIIRLQAGWPPPPPTIIYWSLSLEEQFYLLLPPLIIVSRSFLPWVLAGALVYQFAAPFSPLADFTRPGALAAGVLVAVAARQPWYRRLRPGVLAKSAVARAALTLGAVALLGGLGVESDPARLTLVAVISAGLVLAASFDAFSIWPDRRTAPVMVWLGGRSYALYLSHMVVFRGGREMVHALYGRVPPSGVWFDALKVLLALAVTLLAAELTHRLVEQPGKRLGRRVVSPGEHATLHVTT